jgi:hypothetical protein
MMAAALIGRRFDPDLVASLLDRSVEDVLAVCAGAPICSWCRWMPLLSSSGTR